MNYKDFILKANDNYELSCRLFDCDKKKAIILFVHGMEEYKDRYNSLATFLQKNNYVCLTFDLRGHGKIAPILSHIADKNGDKLLVDDLIVITKYLKEKYNKDIYIFAHSMGSIIVRKLLQTNSNDYKKVVLSGYPNPQKIAKLGVLLSNIISIFKTKKGYSKLLDTMALGNFVKAIKDRETLLDWLSYNKENINNYINDPLCGVRFTIGSYNCLFNLVSDIANYKLYKDINSNLKILLISGKDDPCTGGEKGRKDSFNILKKSGFNDISIETINDCRHEILNEDKKEEIYKIIYEFYNK